MVSQPFSDLSLLDARNMYKAQFPVKSFVRKLIGPTGLSGPIAQFTSAALSSAAAF
jgi:hypothetical protein